MKQGYMEWLWNLLFPRRCPVCGEIVMPKGHLICPECLLKLSFTRQPSCRKCGKELISSHEEYCPDCLRHKRSFEYNMPLLNYTGPAKNAVMAVKYKNKREYLDFFADAICARYGKRIQLLGADALVPVPLHPSRKRKRGYNQAEELAERINSRTGIPVNCKILCREKKTMPLKKLNPVERLENLQKAFTISDGIEKGTLKMPARVILIDDIYTTGSTVEACTRILKRAGAEKVWVITICVGNRS